MSATVLATRGLRKSYAALEVVGGVDITVAQGECFGFISSTRQISKTMKS